MYITIHTGSRNFGGKICKYHQAKINETKFFDYETLNEKMKQIKRKIKDNKQLKAIKDDLSADLNSKRHPDYLEKEESYDYYFDMIFAQKYAKLNRKIILTTILKQIGLQYNPDNVIESIHNYIDFNDLILRKGALIKINYVLYLLICVMVSYYVKVEVILIGIIHQHMELDEFSIGCKHKTKYL